MRTIRRLVYSEVLRAVGFVTLGFLSLFFFFDFIDQLGDLNEGAGRGYRLTQALVYVALQVPGHLYELLPIAVLIWLMMKPGICPTISNAVCGAKRVNCDAS